MNKFLVISFLLFANSVFAIDIDEAIKSTIEKKVSHRLFVWLYTNKTHYLFKDKIYIYTRC